MVGLITLMRILLLLPLKNQEISPVIAVPDLEAPDKAEFLGKKTKFFLSLPPLHFEFLRFPLQNFQLKRVCRKNILLIAILSRVHL
ncbi:MAG: hypothetical protein Ct9H90mP19_5550 [Gammaproteobacteria bacterium]|nr:MAG: hypothetical protein Ct9H90mP19_5550 [Gammaproteobacteria bacterium]